jgi:hypothetical protein
LHRVLDAVGNTHVQEFGEDPVRHLYTALTNVGLIVEKVDGVNSTVFLKVWD